LVSLHEHLAKTEAKKTYEVCHRFFANGYSVSSSSPHIEVARCSLRTHIRDSLVDRVHDL
jgi:hypothetical protein